LPKWFSPSPDFHWRCSKIIQNTTTLETTALSPL